MRAAVALGLGVFAQGVAAQAGAADPIHWAYSAYFGTGAYEVEGGDPVYVIGAQPGWRWRDAALDEQGNRTIGMEFRVPITVGAHRLEVADSGSTLRSDNVGTLSAVPGVELDIPVTPRWSLKPLVYAGWGTELDGDASAWIYWGGLKSRMRFPGDRFEWELVNALTYVGYSSDAGRHENLLPLFTGFEFQRPLGSKRIADEQVYLHWHVAYTSYLNEIEIGPVTATALAPTKVANEWEVGAAFSTGNKRLGWWRLHWDRVGFAYRFSSDGSFEGVSLTFRSLFDR